jgi:2-methylisocitrate lyase-like PEP mutase family enzyme
VSAGQGLRQAWAAERPLQIVGTVNANHALLAKGAGYRAIYLSGGGVAAGSLGVPDLGLNALDDVLTDVRRITDVCPLPLLVVIDTGFGPSAFNIARTVKSPTKAAETVYEAIRRDGTQAAVLPLMQTREELYASIGYHDCEQALDRYNAPG